MTDGLNDGPKEGMTEGQGKSSIARLFQSGAIITHPKSDSGKIKLRCT